MDFAEQLKGAVDIVAVVGEHVRLRKSGAYRYMGLCPFHNEKTPSFTVHATHQFYKCFSCGAGGDVFKFVMEIEGLSFYEALKSLAERYGIPMPKRSQYADEDSRVRAGLHELHEVAQVQFRANLNGPAGDVARAYLARRGVAEATVEQFGLGYADRSGRALARLFEQRQFAAASVEQSGLVGKREDGSTYDRFRHRLMFPIHDRNGHIIGFGGRALAAEDNPKYLNSPETPIYKKSHVLYNLHRAKEAMRKEDRVILVEGYMDAIGVTAAGFPGVVASCGTALTPQQVRLLNQHTARILVNFDPDAAGANAAERSINLLLEEGMQVRIVELDGGLDPDEYCKERGAEAYGQRLENAKGYFHWLADRVRAKHDLRTTEGQVAVLKFLMPAVQRISDRMERMVVAGDLAAYIGVERGLVLDTFKKSVAERQERKFEVPQTPLRYEELALLNGLLADAALAAEMVPELKTLESVNSFASRGILQAMFAIGEAGGRIHFEAVNARLEERDQALLAGAVLDCDLEMTREAVLETMARLRVSEEQLRRTRAKARVKELERAGKWEEALRAMEELRSLERAR